jgi:hypothetical protein
LRWQEIIVTTAEIFETAFSCISVNNCNKAPLALCSAVEAKSNAFDSWATVL